MALLLGWVGVANRVCGATPAASSPYDAGPASRFAEVLTEAVKPAVKGFVAHGGSWEVQDGVLRAAAGAGPKLVYAESSPHPEKAEVDLLFNDRRPGNAGLIMNVREAGAGADAFIGYEIALDPSAQLLRVGRHRHNFELIRDLPCAVATNRWVRLAIQRLGPSIDISVDGKRITAFDDREHPLFGGSVGLRVWQRAASFRNLLLTHGGASHAVPFEGSETTAAGTFPAANLPAIAFIARHPLSRPNTISCDLWQSQPAKPGCRIDIIDPSRPGAASQTIFSDPEGCIYDINLSPDARTLFFSRRQRGDPHWHIWRVGIDGSGLRQLTAGPYYDISPVQLPEGDLLFVSTRRGGYTVCQPGPASNLHRMSANGENIRCLSMNTLADFSPQMLPDGRVLFTRWEYIDRDLTFRQSLWTQNPDGTGYQLYFGNTIRDVGTFWQARPLPGRTDRVVATLAPHHGWPHGAIGIITTRLGPEAPRGQGFVYITREFPSIGDQAFEWSYRDPFPLTEDLFLVSYGGEVNRQRLYLLDSRGNRRLLHEDPAMGCYHPLPLQPTAPPPRLASHQARSEEPWGTFLLQDIYRGMEGIARGRVKYLRVMEQMRKTEDLVNRAYDQSPVMSYGTYYAKRCWGTVPVEADGSAFFKAPALREIYFQALDSEGRELQRMTSAAQLLPGQTLGCVGCHEPRQQAALTGPAPLALRSPARELQKPSWDEDGIVDFPRVVQPVLDQYCVRCHSGADPKAGLTLTGDKTRVFSMAYDNLLGRSRSYRQHNMETGEMLPEEKARPKPLVHFYWLLRTPSAVNQPLWTGSHASRLLDYVDTDHCGEHIPLADRQRIYLWIDADVPYYGTYAHARPDASGRRDLCADPATGRESPWFAQDFLGSYQRRCQSCHGAFPHPNDHGAIWDGRLAWINFTRPELSPALTAQLAQDAGGRGIDRSTNGQSSLLFSTTNAPDYQVMLKAIETGRGIMLDHPEADMPGFRYARKEP